MKDNVVRHVKELTINETWGRDFDPEGMPRKCLVKGFDLQANTVTALQFRGDSKPTKVNCPPTNLRKIPRPEGGL